MDQMTVCYVESTHSDEPTEKTQFPSTLQIIVLVFRHATLLFWLILTAISLVSGNSRQPFSAAQHQTAERQS